MQIKEQATKLFILIVLFIFTATVSAQRNTPGTADSIAVFRLLKMAEKMSDRSVYDSAVDLCNQAINFSRSRNYLYGQAWSYIYLNDVLINKDELQKAEENTLVIYKTGTQLKDSDVVAISFLQKAQVRMYKGELDSAIHNFEKSLSLGLSRKKSVYSALAYNDMGYTWGKKGEPEKLVEACLKSLSIYEANNEPVGCAMALGNISTVYFDLGQKEKALDYARRSLAYREQAGDINKLALACCNLSQMYLGVSIDEAVKYQQLCVKYARQSGQEDRLIHSYITSSLVANGQKKNDEALEYELKTIDLLEKSRSDLAMLARRYISAAYLSEVVKKDSALAVSYFNKSINLSTEIKSKANLRDAYLFMSNFYARRKSFDEAYKIYKKHIIYRDSIGSADKQQNIDELEKKYQIAKKDVEIEKLQSEQRIRQLELDKQKAVINGNLLLAKQKEDEINLLQQERQLQDLQLQKQGEELIRQQLQAKNKEQELKLVQQEKELNQRGFENQKQIRNTIIAGAVFVLLLGGIGFSRYKLKKKLEQQTVMQEMRNHIASDLHDDVGASLSNINILNELTRRNADNPEKVNEYLSRASDDIRQVSEGISDIVWNINPRYDNLEHLFIRMKRYAADIMDAKNINYTIEFPEQVSDIKLEMDKRRDLYLLFKEAVNNLAKYSKAQVARIHLSMENNRLLLKVEDDGIGFNAKEVISGNGLQNMRQRAVLLNGKLDISSRVNEGTCMILEMPV